MVKNIDNVRLSTNELITNHSINRNLQKLLENDIEIHKLYSKYLENVAITEYIHGQSYGYYDLVWFKDNRNNLFLLRSLSENNIETPKAPFNSLWRNENEYKTVLDYDIQQRFSKLLEKNLIAHQTSEYHKFGVLSSIEDLNRKILKNDFSNIDPNRDVNFYPYQTHDILKENPLLSNVILGGYYRIYHNGLMEYDITYRVGYQGTETIENIDYDVLSCNCISIYDNSRESDTSYTKNNNNKYFLNVTDYNIFKYLNNEDENYLINGSIIEKNRNDYVNVYHATIEFPVPFADLNYMVFSNDITNLKHICKKENNLGGIQNVEFIGGNRNKTVFCSKSRKSITALYITYPTDPRMNVGYNTANGGLLANTFNCKIIGFKEKPRKNKQYYIIPIDKKNSFNPIVPKPDIPDIPDEPDVPDIPDEPDIPDTPDIPDEPDVPDTPDEPEITLNIVEETSPTGTVKKSEVQNVNDGYEIWWW